MQVKGDKYMNKKKIITLLLSFIFLLEISGCQSLFPKPHDVALKMMKEKYNTDFTIVGHWGASAGSKTHCYQVTCDLFPDDRIIIEVTKRKDGTVVCRDNFMSYYYRDQTMKKFNEIAGMAFSDWKLRYNIQPLLISGIVDRNSSFEDYLRATSTTFSISIKKINNLMIFNQI